MLILFILPDPPTNPYTSAIPLFIVIAITAVKQAYEDYLRHSADKKINSRVVKVVRNGRFETIQWKDIRV